ncbi:MAG: TetR family transcriptional regulator [Myxococcales bacterium]|nr:TetR family transcriptional regulator [Myxococcales bacterium]
MAEAQLARAGRHRDSRETQERLLDAAERLLAERGFAGTSLRAVTQAAGTSVSAANYHFGSKEELWRATLARRIAPINRRRLESLDALEQAAGGAPLALEAIFEAYLGPLFAERAARHAVHFVAARLYSDPPELVSTLKLELFGEVIRRFLDALARALPDRSRMELGLRFQFAVGCMVHVMSGNLEDAPLLMESVPESAAAAADDVLADASVLRHMVAFIAAGLRAPAGDAR